MRPGRRAAGEQVLKTLVPALADIGAGIDALGDLRERPAGTIRITTGKHAGIRLGERLEQDMVAIPIGPSLRSAVVASPAPSSTTGT